MIQNKKASILLILKVLEDYSDEDHFLTQQEIIDKVYQLYGLQLERKSVGFSLELLDEIGYDINKGIHGGYALFSRNLDTSEVKFLIDAIFSSKAINGKQAKSLAQKVSNELSIYQRKDYSYVYKTSEISRTNNNQVLYNIDTINEAMKKGKRVGFQYIKFDEKGNKVPRMNGYQYRVSPYYMINNFGRYYLLCNYREKYEALSIYRIDYMTNIEIVDDWDIKKIKDLEEFKDKDFNISDYINDHIYLLGGKTVTAELELENENAIGYVIDWFDNNAKLKTVNGKVIATVKCNEQALVYWIMQYGENVKVLSPQSLIDKVVETAHKSFDKYIK